MSCSKFGTREAACHACFQWCSLRAHVHACMRVCFDLAQLAAAALALARCVTQWRCGGEIVRRMGAFKCRGWLLDPRTPRLHILWIPAPWLDWVVRLWRLRHRASPLCYLPLSIVAILLADGAVHPHCCPAFVVGVSARHARRARWPCVARLSCVPTGSRIFAPPQHNISAQRRCIRCLVSLVPGIVGVSCWRRRRWTAGGAGPVFKACSRQHRATALGAFGGAMFALLLRPLGDAWLPSGGASGACGVIVSSFAAQLFVFTLFCGSH